MVVPALTVDYFLSLTSAYAHWLLSFKGDEYRIFLPCLVLKLHYLLRQV